MLQNEIGAEGNNKKKLAIIIGGIVLALLLIGLVFFLIFNSFGDKPVDSTTSSNPNITTGDTQEITDNGSSDTGDVSSDTTDSGDNDNSGGNGYAESSGSDTNKPNQPSSTTSKPSTSSDFSKGNPGNSIPDVTNSETNYTGLSGFVDYEMPVQPLRKYEEYRFLKVLPDKFQEIAESARTLLREALFVRSENYYQPLDYQREVTQTNKYVFQNVGSTCTDPTQQYFVKYEGNPVLWGQNLYTPWIVKHDDTWFVYYGGYGDEQTNGMDITFLATTKDPELRSGWTLHGPVVTPGGDYLCAQDPAVYIKDDLFYMVYSYTKIYNGQGRDWIGVATSEDGINWTPDTPSTDEWEITIKDYTRTKEDDYLGRPSLYYNEKKSRWEMYADGFLTGTGDTQKGMYLLYSYDEGLPLNWELAVEGQVMANAGESALAVIDDTYYFAYRPTNENWPTRMRMATSKDGINFEGSTLTIVGEELSNGQVNNVSMLAFAVDDNKITSIMYGRSLEGWSHKVSIAYPQKVVEAWRGGEKIDAEPTALSATTQAYDSEGSASAITNIRILPQYGQPAEFETNLYLRPNMAYYYGELTQAPEKPEIVAPYNNSTKQHWGPQFSWLSVSGAQSYKLMVAEDENFTQNAFYVKALFTEEYRPINALEEGKTYYWKIIASNHIGSTESDVNKFTVVGENELIGEYLDLYPTNIEATEDANSDSSVNNLSDGPYYTFWTAFVEEDNPPYFTMDYGKAFPITRFYYTPRADGTGLPVSIQLEYSLDGKNFERLLPEEYTTDIAVCGGVTVNYVTLKKPIEARFVRFTITESMGAMAGLGEFRSQVLR